MKWLVGPEEGKPLDLKIRGLYVGTRLKEYTTGAPHEVTDRLFVVRRVFRLNDTLPDETGPAPRWQWERAVRDRRATGTPQTDSEETAGRAWRRRRARFGMPGPPAGNGSPRA